MFFFKNFGKILQVTVRKLFKNNFNLAHSITLYFQTYKVFTNWIRKIYTEALLNIKQMNIFYKLWKNKPIIYNTQSSSKYYTRILMVDHQNLFQKLHCKLCVTYGVRFRRFSFVSFFSYMYLAYYLRLVFFCTLHTFHDVSIIYLS